MTEQRVECVVMSVWYQRPVSVSAGVSDDHDDTVSCHQGHYQQHHYHHLSDQ